MLHCTPEAASDRLAEKAWNRCLPADFKSFQGQLPHLRDVEVDMAHDIDRLHMLDISLIAVCNNAMHSFILHSLLAGQYLNVLSAVSADDPKPFASRQQCI